MSAVTRAVGMVASKAASSTGRDSQISRKKSLGSAGEVYHRVSRWYPSVSATPEETIVLTVNGGSAGQTLGGKSTKADVRNESRLGTLSSNNESEPLAESQPIKTDHKLDKLSRMLNIKQEQKE